MYHAVLYLVAVPVFFPPLPLMSYDGSNVYYYTCDSRSCRLLRQQVVRSAVIPTVHRRPSLPTLAIIKYDRRVTLQLLRFPIIHRTISLKCGSRESLICRFRGVQRRYFQTWCSLVGSCDNRKEPSTLKILYSMKLRKINGNVLLYD